MSDQEGGIQYERKHLKKLGDGLRNTGSLATIDVDGVAINYWQAGNGAQTVVFLHGNSCAKEVFYEQFAHLADTDFTLIALDLPGHGGSSDAADPDSQYTIPGYALLINNFLVALSITDYICVGWSLGGNIALEMAANNCPMAAMMLMGAPPVGPGPENFEKAYLPATLESAAVNDGTGNDEITAFVKSVYGKLHEIPNLFLQAAIHTDARARGTMMAHWLSGTSGHNQLKTAARWDKPICVAHGQKEPFVSLGFLENVKWKNLWRNKVHLLEKGGHAPFVEDAHAFNVLLDHFIADVSSR